MAHSETGAAARRVDRDMFFFSSKNPGFCLHETARRSREGRGDGTGAGGFVFGVGGRDEGLEWDGDSVGVVHSCEPASAAVIQPAG